VIVKVGFKKRDLRKRYFAALAAWGVVFGVFLMASVFSFDIINVNHEGTNLIRNLSGVAKEDVNFIINLSINSSNYTLPTDATNITNISITLPNGFSYNNFTLALNTTTNYSVVNTSSVITINATDNGTALVINNTAVYLWFTVNASAPGNYNMTVTTFNGSSVGLASLLNSTIISIVVNDTTIPNNIFFQGPTPENGSYVSSDSIFLNASIYDNGAIQAIFSTLGWANSSGAINKTNLTTISNSSQEARLQYNFTYNFSGLIEGIYVLNITVNDTFNNLNSTSYSRTITLDRTYPIPSYGVGTDTTNAYVNRSFVIVNVSIIEANFNFTNISLHNSSGGVARSNLTRSNASALYINFTSLSQGVYYFNATVNDSAGNVNYTLGTRNITLDWTAPSITHSCTPGLTVSASSNLTCTCTATDNVDSSPNVTYTASPPTQSTGTFTTSCTAKDRTNNTAINTITYTVEQGGSGSGSGSGSGGNNAKTINVDNKAFEAGYTNILKASEKMKVNVQLRSSNGQPSGQNESHTLTIISLNSSEKSAIVEVASSPVRATMKVGESKKFEVTGDNYYDLHVALNSVGPVLANVTIKSVYELMPADARRDEPVTNIVPADSGNNSAINDSSKPVDSEVAAKNIWWIIVVVFVIVIGVVGYYIYRTNKKEHK